jgi:hypothetical protein
MDFKFEFFGLMTKICVTRAASFTPQWTQMCYMLAARSLVIDVGRLGILVKDYAGPMVCKALS